MARQVRGSGKRGPRDTYTFASLTVAGSCTPSLSNTYWSNLWGCGQAIAQILTNVRAEAISTLIGGAVLYQPTLLIHGFADLYIYSAATTDINFEYVVYTTSGGSGVNQTVANDIASFTTGWGDSYDARPTGYENWPATSLLRNYAAWSGRSPAGFKPTHHGFGTAPVGKPLKLRFRFKTRAFQYQDYTSSTFLTDGMIRNKSHRVVVRFWGEHGHVCGVIGANDQPILQTVGTQVLLKTTETYSYKWLAGNNRPTVYGTQLGTGETIDNEAHAGIGINALKATRGGNYRMNAQETTSFPNFGWLHEFRRQEAQLNPEIDCTGGKFTPSVSLLP